MNKIEAFAKRQEWEYQIEIISAKVEYITMLWEKFDGYLKARDSDSTHIYLVTSNKNALDVRFKAIANLVLTPREAKSFVTGLSELNRRMSVNILRTS